MTTYTVGIGGSPLVPIPRDEDLYMPGEAAELLGLTIKGLQSALHNGTLQAVRLDKRTIAIRQSEIERYRRENLGKRGRPRKGRAQEDLP
jgi:hypothetical protein